MNLKRTALLTVSLLATTTAAIADVATPGFNATQVQNIEKVVHDYLVSHPEVLIEASQALQSKQQKQMQNEANSFIQKNAKELLTENITTSGSKAPNVTIVEFFDYQCGHCKKMQPVMTELVKKNPNVRVVYREFPIFGKSSTLASQAAVAAALQGKYTQMQELLFNEKKIDEQSIQAIAKKAGLDMVKFQADMKGKAVSENLSHNRKLAESMKLFGTPVIIVMSTPKGQFNPNIQPVMIPGSTSLENLQQLVMKASEAK